MPVTEDKRNVHILFCAWSERICTRAKTGRDGNREAVEKEPQEDGPGDALLGCSPALSLRCGLEIVV